MKILIFEMSVRNTLLYFSSLFAPRPSSFVPKLSVLLMFMLSLSLRLSAQLEPLVLLVADSNVSETKPFLFNHALPTAFLNPFATEWNHEATPNRFEIDAGFDGNSNGISQQFVWNILFGNDFNQKTKDKMRSIMRPQNGYEDNQTAGIRYKRYFKKFDGYFMAGYHLRTMRTAFLNKEVFELVFYGNAMFENQTVDISRLYFQNLIYNQFSLGFLKNIRKENHNIAIGLNASFLHGLNSQYLFFNKGKIYTAPDGEYLDVVYEMKYNQGRFGNKREKQNVDIGMSGDFHVSYQYKDKFRIAFSIIDFGVINWRWQPQNLVGNDSIRFKGIEFADVTAIANGSFSDVKIDSILGDLLPDKRSDQYQSFIPYTMSLVASAPVWKDKIVVHAGLQYKPLYRYYVYGFAKVNYFIQPTLVTSVTLGYGGYSKFNLGIEAAKRWKNFDFSIGTNNLIGTVAPAAYTGVSAYLRMGVNF